MDLTDNIKEKLKLLKEQAELLTERQSTAQRTIRDLQNQIKGREAQNKEFERLIAENNRLNNAPKTGSRAVIESLQAQIKQDDELLRKLHERINAIN